MQQSIADIRDSFDIIPLTLGLCQMLHIMSAISVEVHSARTPSKLCSSGVAGRVGCQGDHHIGLGHSQTLE